jgi:hypothetical protein
MFRIGGAAVFPRAKAEDRRCGGEVWEALDRAITETGENRRQMVAPRNLNRRQLSTTERIAATFGPACGLPMCIQFFRPKLL